MEKREGERRREEERVEKKRGERETEREVGSEEEDMLFLLTKNSNRQHRARTQQFVSKN